MTLSQAPPYAMLLILVVAALTSTLFNTGDRTPPANSRYGDELPGDCSKTPF